MEENHMKTIRLSNGVEVPALGFGTFQITDPQEAETAVANAIDAGYRHIDTAQSYMNEEAVGRGIADAPVRRDELFVTTKIWVENVSYEGVKTSFERSLSRLKMDYVDLLLIHQPYNDVFGAWRAMEELQTQGKVRAIGVSNFDAAQVVDLAEFNKTAPQVDQIEINPFQQQVKTLQALRDANVAPEAWAPFAEGKHGLFTNPTLAKIAEKHHKSIAQVILRWLIEQDIIVLAKSVKPERMAQNLDIFDFELTADDQAAIKTLDQEESQFFSHTDPEMVHWMASRKLNV
jgi:diketogulonate reductase-like aldo/keto reductase